MGCSEKRDPWHDILHVSSIFWLEIDRTGENFIGRTTAKVYEAYTQLKRKADIIGLIINATKTKYLLAEDSDRLGSSVSVDGDNLKVVKEF